jgi:hypothetical protein
VTPTEAVLHFAGVAFGIPEFTYPFTVSVPVVVENRTWQYVVLDGEVKITAVADPTLSSVLYCRAETFTCNAWVHIDHLCWAECQERSGPCRFCGDKGKCCRKGWEKDLNGCSPDEGGDGHHKCVYESGPPTVIDPPKTLFSTGSIEFLVEVLARDLSGFTVHRPGEEIDIALLWNGASIRSMRALYSEKSQMYYAEIRLVKVGRYIIDITTPLGTQTKANFTVQCKDGYKVSADAECVLDCAMNGTKSIMVNGICKSKPKMELKASSAKVVMTVPKSSKRSNGSATIELQLARGEVAEIDAITWNVSSSASWLQLGQLTGSVHSLSPIAVISVVVDASHLNDTIFWNASSSTAVDRPYTANITVFSTARGFADDSGDTLFIDGTNRLDMVVEASVKAIAEIKSEDVRIQPASSNQAIRNADDVVVAGDSLLVHVYTKDKDRHNISRVDQQIRLQLILAGNSKNKEVVMMHDRKGPGGNAFKGEIPATWMSVEGDYELRLMSVEGDYELRLSDTTLVKFTVGESSNLFLIVGVSCAIPLGILLIGLVVLVYFHQDRAKQLVTSFIQFELRTCAEFSLDVLDVVGEEPLSPTIPQAAMLHL